MTKNKLWKRVTAGALALTIVAGAAPAGVNWDKLLGVNPLVASAAKATDSYTLTSGQNSSGNKTVNGTNSTVRYYYFQGNNTNNRTGRIGTWSSYPAATTGNMTVTAGQGKVLTSVVLTVNSSDIDKTFTASAGEVEKGDNTITIKNINASSVTLNGPSTISGGYLRVTNASVETIDTQAAPQFDYPTFFDYGKWSAPEIPAGEGETIVSIKDSDGNVAENLVAGNEYTLSAYYKGNDEYAASEVTEKKFTIHQFTKHAAVAPECENDGNVEYYTDENDAFYVKKDNDYTVVESEEDLVVPAAGHKFSSVEYEWNGFECTATATCTVDGCNKLVTEKATVTSAITEEPTVNEDGVLTYTAEFKTKGFNKKTKTDKIPKLVPTLVARVDPTLDDEGMEEHYEYTPDGGETQYYVLSNETYFATTAAALAIPKLIVTEVAYNAPTCTAAGNIAYGTDKDGKFYVKGEDGKYAAMTDLNEDGKVDADDTVIAATGHTYGAASYTWRGNSSSATCTASHTCTADNYTETERVTAVVDVVTPATVNSTGTGRWKAIFTKEGFEDQIDTAAYRVITIPKIKPTEYTTVVATVNAAGTAAHYEAVIDEETHYYLLNETTNIYEEVKPESLVLERLVPEKHDADSATCEEDGNIEYYTIVNDDESVSFFTYDAEKDTYTEINEADTVEKAKGHTPPETPVIENYKKATCAEEGSYDLVEYCKECEKELSRTTVTVPKTDHTAGEPVIENVVPATYTSEGSYDSVVYCTECGEEISRKTITVPKLSALTRVAAKDATCETNGNIEYWYDAKEDKYFSDADGKNEITEADVTIKALGHTYGSPEWRWKSPTEVTAKFTCTRECGHTETVNATVTSVVTVEPTYTSTGKIVYTAKVTFNGKTYSSSRTSTLAKLGVTHVDKVDPTCTEPGNIEYWYDAANDKYFSDANATKEITKEDTVLEATGHTYGAPTWVWNGTKSATAEFACTNGDDTQSVEATVTSSTVEPTYTKTGKLIYTATAKFGGKTYSAIKEITLSKLTYTAPTITAKKGEGAVKLSWNEVDFAEKYAVVCEVNKEWKLVGKTTETEFIVEDLTAGKEYKVAVIPMFDGEWFKDYSNAITVTPKAAATHVYPTVTSIDYNETYHQFRLKWEAMEGAQQYGLAVFVANKWKAVAQDISPKTLSWTSPKLKAGQTYKMVLCAKVNGSWDTSNIEARAFSVTVK
jgi:hypothetical protein